MEREFEGSSGTGRQVAKKKEIKLHDEWDETVWVYRLGSVGWIIPFLMDLLQTLTA